jgi:multimeric flavodoxin WrbA
MKVVAFSGSARKDGNTAILLRTALGVLEEHGIETELMQLAGQAIHGCRACFGCFGQKTGRCVVDDDVANECIEKALAADGILLGSPTYFADITPELKALVDRLGFVAMANGGLLRRKVGAAVVAVRRSGAIHAFDSINHLFLISEMIIPGSRYWNIGLGGEKGEVTNDAEGIEIMRTLGENMAWLLEKLHA